MFEKKVKESDFNLAMMHLRNDMDKKAWMDDFQHLHFKARELEGKIEALEAKLAVTSIGVS